MGILQQEMGEIGWLPADVSAYVTDQRGEAVCSAVMCLMELNLIYWGSFLKVIKVILPLEGIISSEIPTADCSREDR